MVFKPGESGNTLGRPKGSLNKTTRAVKETFEKVFDAIQDDGLANLESWAKENPDKFYPLAAKLIPAEITGQIQIVPVLNVLTSRADDAKLIEGDTID